MSDADEGIDGTLERLKQLAAESERKLRQMQADARTRTTRLRVNKRTHRIRFERETEETVEVVIEPKDKQP
jgi:hypothetical protein